MFGHVALDVLHDDDRVVHHNAYGKDQPEECHHVDGKPQQRHHGKRPDKRHRNGDEGNQGRSPALQKDEDHCHNENKCLE